MQAWRKAMESTGFSSFAELREVFRSVDKGWGVACVQYCQKQISPDYVSAVPLVPESNCFETTGANYGFQRSVISSLDIVKLKGPSSH